MWGEERAGAERQTADALGWSRSGGPARTSPSKNCSIFSMVALRGRPLHLTTWSPPPLAGAAADGSVGAAAATEEGGAVGSTAGAPGATTCCAVEPTCTAGGGGKPAAALLLPIGFTGRDGAPHAPPPRAPIAPTEPFCCPTGCGSPHTL